MQRSWQHPPIVALALLNVYGSFSLMISVQLKQHELASPPTEEEEVMEAERKLKNGKAGDNIGILLEVLKGCGGQIMNGPHHKYVPECVIL